MTGTATTPVERDSAGVAIVENRAPPDALPRWTLEAEPALDVGSPAEAGGSAVGVLFGIEPGALAPDGRVAVANAGAHEVRLYDPSGRHLMTLGRGRSRRGEEASPRAPPPSPTSS